MNEDKNNEDFVVEIEDAKQSNSVYGNGLLPLLQKKITSFEHFSVKNYLFAVYQEVLSEENFKIHDFNVFDSHNNPFIIKPNINKIDENGRAVLSNDYLYIKVEYQKSLYQITLYITGEQSGGMVPIHNYNISILSVGINAGKNDKLLKYITRKAIENSIYKNKVIKLTFDFDGNYTVNEIPNSEFTYSTLDKVFVPFQIENELNRFHNCIKRFNEINMGLRYLFVGEPGTGKTLSTRAIINECKGKVTTILAEGSVNFSSLFSFASYFNPCLVCFDDLDLVFGTRGGNYNPWALSDFLASMDGLIKNDLFLLASTNDMDFLDQAAARPGRFDAVLHFGKLNRNNYMDIIKSHCKSTEVAELFDEELLDLLKRKNITGAFLSNLIKQLEIKHILEPTENISKYINEYIKLNHKGFYNNGNKQVESIGFN